MPIDSIRPDVANTLPIWKRCRDVLAGSDAVKAAGTTYLPKLAAQRDGDFQSYLSRANFFNGTARTRAALVGSVFAKDPMIKLPEDIRARLSTVLDDVDYAGTTLRDFALGALEEVIGVGRFGALVDLPDEGTDERARRPYVVAYRAEDIINWRLSRVGGDPSVLSLVVLRESVDQASENDRYVTTPVERFRVLELVSVEGAAPVYVVNVFQRKQAGEKLEPVHDPLMPTRRGAPLTFIPFTFISPSSTRPEIEKAPLLDMVDVNLSHYRSSADLEHARHFAGLPTFWVRGAKAQGDLPIGPTAVWKLEGEHATAGVLEISGQCLPELRLALDQKAEQMAVLGARLIEQAKAKAETAESVKARNAAAYATLRTIAGSVSLGMTHVLRWLVWWSHLDVPASEIGVELNREFVDYAVGPEELKALVQAHQAGAMSFETFYWNLRRGNRARPGISDAEERHAIEAGDHGVN